MQARELLSRQERKARTRDQLIEAAAAVFASRGYEATSLDDVAAAAGYTKGAVYSNFRNKEDLFFALIDRRIAEQTARLEDGLALTGGAGTGAAAETGAGSEWSVEWLMLAIEFWLHAMRHERARELLAAQYERFRSASSVIIGAAFERAGAALPMPPRDMAILVEALGIGLGIQVALDPGHVRMALQREAIARLVGPEVLQALARPVAPGASGGDEPGSGN